MFDLTREELFNILPVAFAVLVAGLGWVITYFHKWYFDNKTNRINMQLKELYGPLYARLMASDSAWNAFWKKHRPSHRGNSYFGANLPVTDREKEIWRNWMTNVFEPNNSEMEKLILNNIELLDFAEIPQPFIEALAHIATYKAILANWKRSDFTEHVSINNWPNQQLIDIVKPEYDKLRVKQQKMINT